MSRLPEYDISISKRVEQGEKSFSTRVGAGFVNKAGGINLKFGGGVQLLITEGVEVTLWPRKERDGDGGGQRREPQRGGFQDDDHPPF